MKITLFIIFQISLFACTSEMCGQDYFAGDPKERCIDNDFKETLINAFRIRNGVSTDTVPYFRNGDIAKVTYETKCGTLQNKKDITGAPDFSSGKLVVSYRNEKVAGDAYTNLLLRTKHPAYTYLYGMVKAGPMYMCLINDTIEFYLTILYNPGSIDEKKLEQYLRSNIKIYDHIVILSSNQTVIK